MSETKEREDRESKMAEILQDVTGGKGRVIHHSRGHFALEHQVPSARGKEYPIIVDLGSGIIFVGFSHYMDEAELIKQR